MGLLILRLGVVSLLITKLKLFQRVTSQFTVNEQTNELPKASKHDGSQYFLADIMENYIHAEAQTVLV